MPSEIDVDNYILSLIKVDPGDTQVSSHRDRDNDPLVSTFSRRVRLAIFELLRKHRKFQSFRSVRPFDRPGRETVKFISKVLPIICDTCLSLTMEKWRGPWSGKIRSIKVREYSSKVPI